MSYNIGYIEKKGRCVIKKIRDYGKKYRIYFGTSFKEVATIHQARQFAIEDFQSSR